VRIIRIIFINVVIFIVLLEIVSLILIKFTTLPNGLITGAVLRADEKYSTWHPKNFKIKLARRCWESYVQFNSIGLKQTEEIGIKTKKRIAILGSSMTEMLQLSNEKDLRAKLKKLMPDYEIINFSVASTGLADQIEIYKNLIKQYDIDYLFLYATENDIEVNYIDKYRPNRITYKYEGGKVVKLEKSHDFFEEYNSKYNRFKREELMNLKKISSFYKIYAYVKYDLLQNLNNKQNKKNVDLYKNKKVYEFILKHAEKEIFNDVKTLIFMNMSAYEERSESRNIMIKLLNKYDFFYDPMKDAIEFMKKRNKYKFPYLGHECDGHYTELGAEFLASYSYKIFNSNYIK